MTVQQSAGQIGCCVSRGSHSQLFKGVCYWGGSLREGKRGPTGSRWCCFSRQSTMLQPAGASELGRMPQCCSPGLHGRLGAQPPSCALGTLLYLSVCFLTMSNSLDVSSLNSSGARKRSGSLSTRVIYTHPRLHLIPLGADEADVFAAVHLVAF